MRTRAKRKARAKARPRPVDRRRSKNAKPAARMKHPARADGLEINSVEDGFMIYQPEKDRVHYLNHTAIVVLELCDGKTSPERIADILRKAYGLSRTRQKEVNQVLLQMKEEELVR